MVKTEMLVMVKTEMLVMVKTEMGWPGDCYYSIIFFSRLSYQEWEGALRSFHNLTFLEQFQLTEQLYWCYLISTTVVRKVKT